LPNGSGYRAYGHGERPGAVRRAARQQPQVIVSGHTPMSVRLLLIPGYARTGLNAPTINARPGTLARAAPGWPRTARQSDRYERDRQQLLKACRKPITKPIIRRQCARLPSASRSHSAIGVRCGCDSAATAGLYNVGMVVRKADTPQLARRRTSPADAPVVHADLIAA